MSIPCFSHHIVVTNLWSKRCSKRVILSRAQLSYGLNRLQSPYFVKILLSWRWYLDASCSTNQEFFLRTFASRNMGHKLHKNLKFYGVASKIQSLGRRSWMLIDLLIKLNDRGMSILCASASGLQISIYQCSRAWYVRRATLFVLTSYWILDFNRV